MPAATITRRASLESRLPDHARASRSQVLETLPRPLLLILPLFVVVAAAEGLYLQARRGQRYDWRAFFASLGDAMGRRLIFSAIGVGAITAILALAWSCRITTIPMDRWWSWVLLFLGEEFCYYWMHRADHRIRWMWATHAVHHSSEDVDWISAARFHPVNLLLGTIGVDVVLLLAGISPGVMLWLGPLNIFHSAFVHANLNWTLGPFRYVLATPVFHRWHHTSREEGGDTNFAGTFPLWDILFGTFRMPEDTLPDRYGVDDQSSFPREIIGQLAYPFRK